MKIKSLSGLFPIALVFYLIFGIVGILFFVFFIKQIIYFIIVLAIVILLVMFARGSLKTPTKATPYIVVFIVVILMILALGSSLLNTTLMVWKPDFKVEETTVENRLGWGSTTRWTGHVELDDTKYITSMFKNYEGEKILTAQSWLKLDHVASFGWSDVIADAYWYEIFYADSQDNWKSIDTQLLTDINCRIGKDNAYYYSTSEQSFGTLHTITHESCSFKILGPKVGGIKVVLMVHWDEFSFGVKSHGDTWASKDEAYLYSGVGFTDVKGVIDADGTVNYGATTAEEGGKVIIHFECGAGIWFAKIFKTRTGETSLLDQRDLDEGCNLDWQVPIPVGTFVPSSDPLENQYTVRLYNSVIEQSKDDFFTVDKREYIPDKDDITISANVGYAIVGKDVTITMSAKVNNATNIPIGSFNIWVWYGQYKPGTEFESDWIADNLIISDVREVSNGTYQAEYTFKAHKEGTIGVEVKAIDTEGRASDAVAMKLNVYWNEDSVGLQDRLGGWFWLVILVLILVIIVAGYYIIKYYRRR